MTSQVRLEARTEVVQHIPLLLAAGRDHCQHPFDEPAALGTVRPPADPPPDHRMPQRAFRGVIRRLDPLDARKGPQALLHLEDLKAGRRRLDAAAPEARFQSRLDLTPNSRKARPIEIIQMNLLSEG